MRITIVGAGAIGGLAGAYMTMNGADVTMVDIWKEHVDAINAQPLQITGVRGEMQVKMKAMTPDALSGPLELMILSTKSQHTEQAVKGVLDKITPETIVVSMQNGFNVERIEKYVPTSQVIGTVPNYGGALVDPGHLEFVHEGPLHIGELDGRTTKRIEMLRDLYSPLTATHISDNIIGEIWGKQVYFSMITMTALVDAPISAILTDMRYRLMGGALVQEALNVSNAAGITIPPSASFDPAVYDARTPEETKLFVKEVGALLSQWAQRAPNATKLVKTGSGPWWDIVYRKRKSETQGLTGAVVDKARELGVRVPANERLVEMVYEIEDGKRQLGWHNLSEIADYMNSIGVALPQ